MGLDMCGRTDRSGPPKTDRTVVQFWETVGKASMSGSVRVCVCNEQTGVRAVRCQFVTTCWRRLTRFDYYSGRGRISKMFPCSIGFECTVTNPECVFFARICTKIQCLDLFANPDLRTSPSTGFYANRIHICCTRLVWKYTTTDK